MIDLRRIWSLINAFMTPEQWEQIGQFYHAALESAPPERADFVARVCAGDEALRRLWVRQLAAFSSA
ncbi:MAG: hypothetical protein L0312_24795, partial [Acidobacteria bacterium]|nr:hypothetical protein [Acidobacteriota bacterium]